MDVHFLRAARAVGPVKLLFGLVGAAHLYWSNAVANSTRAATRLAVSVRAWDDQPTFDLAGHSLGARIALRILDSHAGPDRAWVRNVVLFGAAAMREDSRWSRRLESVGGRVLNVYSEKDQVLQKLFWGASGGGGALGLGSTEDTRIEDHDATSLLPSGLMESHTYKDLYGRFLEQIQHE
ncbi:DUF726 domain-containing protein [bacterium]|nr:DUF726 domain-containing protein [bacterium]